MGTVFILTQPTCQVPNAVIYATANEGYHFVRWNDYVTNVTRTVTVISDTAFTAYFEADAVVVETYTVTIVSVDPTMGNAAVNGEASATVEEGEIVTLTATANEGYHFVRWNDNDTNSTRTVTVTSDTTFIAYFAADGTEEINDLDGSNAKVYSTDGRIVVENTDGNTVILYDAAGRILAIKQSSIQAITFDIPATGTYLVKVGDAPARRIVVVR